LGVLALWKSRLAPKPAQRCNKISISALVCLLAYCTWGNRSTFGQLPSWILKVETTEVPGLWISRNQFLFFSPIKVNFKTSVFGVQIQIRNA